MVEKILVTGGVGYIGSHTVVELQLAGFDVVVIDNLSNSNIKTLDGIAAITGKQPIFYEVDCNDKAAVSQVISEHPTIKGVIHFAASKAVGESVHKPLLYYRNNIFSLINILELMGEHGGRIKGLVFSSSCTVYGQPEELPVTEDSPILPAISPYGNTKQIDEEIIRDTIYAGVPFKATLLRYFNPIGAHPSTLIGELPIGIPQNLVPYLTQTAAGIRKELNVFGNDYNTPDGSCVRDYVDVVDLAKAHVKAIERMMVNEVVSSFEVFNIGTGRGVSVFDLINTFQSTTGVKVPYIIVGRREGDIEQVWACPKRANDILGWRAEVSLAESLNNAWKWQQSLNQ